MAGSKKKKNLTLIVLLIALILMIAACFSLIKYKDKKAANGNEDSTKETETIANVETDTIQTIYFKNKDNEMTLVKGDDGNWKNSEDEAFPVNQTNAGNMAKAFTDIASSRTITEGVDDLSNFGLDNPAITVTATAKDGTKTTITLGNEAPIGGGYYGALNEDKKVYVLTAAFYNNFTYTLEQMTTVETIPSITATNITHLTVLNKDKPGFEIVYDGSKATDFAGLTKWAMKQPYKTTLPADADAVNTLLGNYSAMSFTSCVDYNASDLSKYGLDDPAASVSLEYFEEYTKDKATSDDKATTDTADNNTQDAKEDEKTKINYTLDLLIGSKDAEGNYYVKTKDSKAVNIMSADTVEKLITIDAYSNVDHYVNLVNLDSINQLDISVDGKTYTLTTEKAEEAKDDTQTKDDTQSGDSKEEVINYYFNGNKVGEDDFKSLYQTIISPTTERDIPEEYFTSNTDQTPVMTLTYHQTDGNTIEIQYKPYDDSYYVVNTNGLEYFLTDMRKVNDIKTALVNFMKNK
ncbi:DUF4340 domain-containing protein [Anaerocolumna sedimenticola]|uniref:DUF4340 domain-containing protein n=1 Tax=Anaerocolumna sedimenticola TaxID=2696063 RepID=A0A6P1TL48_9FIRM|nr:DUF4340 domain-containing protein [Anaerocolumna sedimenticola]QHQ61153.1 DUF4340 domain-containing protein [Anaerocolumna sedimenticola]